MTTPRTHADIGRANSRKGKEAERNVARYLRAHGFPHAERAVRTGYTTDTRAVSDPGDITGTPGLVWQVKDQEREHVEHWMLQTEGQADSANADLGLLIVRRRGKAEPGRWWAWLPIIDLTWLATGSYDAVRALGRRTRLARVELGDLVPLLLAAGYGQEVPGE